MLSIHRLGLVLGVLSVSSMSADAATILSYDDGQLDRSWGQSGAFTFKFFVNYATPNPGLTQVTAMQTMFHPSAVNGSPITVGLWSDPNGDGLPSDAVLLATSSATISGAGTSTFINYPFASGVTVASPRFFIGYLVSGSNSFPAGYDTNTPTPNASWAAAGGTDMSILSPNQNLNSSLAGVLMIRAEVAAVPEPAAAACHLVLGAGAVGLIGRRQRRRR